MTLNLMVDEEYTSLVVQSTGLECQSLQRPAKEGPYDVPREKVQSFRITDMFVNNATVGTQYSSGQSIFTVYRE